MKKILFNHKDLYINFKNNDSNMIIVTGISGAGKSTLCEKLKEEYSYEVISFDMIFGYEESREMTKIEKEILCNFQKQYPKYTNLALNKNNNSICNDFFDFVEKYITEKDIKIIFDGSYFLKRVAFEKIKNQRIILKQTSLIKSLIRRIKRNKKYILNHHYSKKRTIKELYWMHRYNIKNILKWKIEKKHFMSQIKEMEWS